MSNRIFVANFIFHVFSLHLSYFDVRHWLLKIESNKCLFQGPFFKTKFLLLLLAAILSLFLGEFCNASHCPVSREINCEACQAASAQSCKLVTPLTCSPWVERICSPSPLSHTISGCVSPPQNIDISVIFIIRDLPVSPSSQNPR